MAEEKKVRLIVHGGAWGIPDDQVEAHLEGVKEAVEKVFPLLQSGSLSALDAVELAVSILEDNFTFDAGKGSVLNLNAEIEMDALIMDGKTLNAGAVAALQNFQNPIKIARKVMEMTEHVMIVGKGAGEFASRVGFSPLPPDQLICDREKEFLIKVKSDPNYKSFYSFKSQYLPPSLKEAMDTVGAVAMDREGNIACATSTGGTARKIPGRVGDSPIIGAGGYADNLTGGISSTGWGESILKVMLAKHVSDLLSIGSSAMEAAVKGISSLSDPRVNGYGGVIVIDHKGEYGFHHNTPRMAFSYANDNGDVLSFVHSNDAVHPSSS